MTKTEILWAGIGGLAGSLILAGVHIAGQFGFSWVLTGAVLSLLRLGAYLIWVPYFLVLYRLLRRHHPALSLYAVSFVLIAVAVFASSSLHGWTMNIRTDYFIPEILRPETSEAERELLQLMELSTTGLYIASAAVAYLASTAGMFLFGIAFITSPSFGRVIGWTSVVLGSLGFMSSLWLAIDQESPGGLPALIVLIVTNSLAGWKVIRHSGK